MEIAPTVKVNYQGRSIVRKQSGFTLIEIAIVLVIIGLLLGGVLKGQELIQSARVRNLASMQDGVKAAFFGFQDRFRALPGDYTTATTNITGVAANAGCTGAVTGNGNGDGQIALAGESILAWEHLSKAGFINGSYTCSVAAGADVATSTPVNAYNIYLQLVYDGVYGVTGAAAAVRHNLKSGPGIPVSVIAELDRKVDDGLPGTGTFQFSTYASNGTAPTGAGAAAPSCVTTAVATTSVWGANFGTTNCGGSTLF